MIHQYFHLYQKISSLLRAVLCELFQDEFLERACSWQYIRYPGFESYIPPEFDEEHELEELTKEEVEEVEKKGR